MVYAKRMTEDELYHHGILGMKWGKRNGPPYPLGAGDHSASENKAGWRKSLAGGGHRALAKVYEVNEKYYSKNNRNETLANANKHAKETQLKKAEEAQKEKDAKNARKDAIKKYTTNSSYSGPYYDKLSGKKRFERDAKQLKNPAIRASIGAGAKVASKMLIKYGSASSGPISNAADAAGRILGRYGNLYLIFGAAQIGARSGTVVGHTIRGDYSSTNKSAINRELSNMKTERSSLQSRNKKLAESNSASSAARIKENNKRIAQLDKGIKELTDLKK